MPGSMEVMLEGNVVIIMCNKEIAEKADAKRVEYLKEVEGRSLFFDGREVGKAHMPLAKYYKNFIEEIRPIFYKATVVNNAFIGFLSKVAVSLAMKNLKIFHNDMDATTGWVTENPYNLSR